MTTSSNLIQGSALLFAAPVGTDLPTVSDLSALVAGSLTDWTTLGQTTKAVELIDTPTFVDAMSQQSLRPLAKAISSAKTTVKTGLREITIQRLVEFSRGVAAPSTGEVTVTPGGIGIVPELSLAMVGPWSGGGTCLFVAERVVYDAAQTLSFDVSKFLELDVEFEVLESSTLVGGYKITATVAA